MDNKFDVKRKYKVDGVEYDSLDAMPADVRHAVERATSGRGLALRLLLILAGVLVLWLGWFFLKGAR